MYFWTLERERARVRERQRERERERERERVEWGGGVNERERIRGRGIHESLPSGLYKQYYHFVRLTITKYKLASFEINFLLYMKTKGEKPQMSTFAEAEKIINCVFEDFSILTILHLLWFT